VNRRPSIEQRRQHSLASRSEKPTGRLGESMTSSHKAVDLRQLVFVKSAAKKDLRRVPAHRRERFVSLQPKLYGSRPDGQSGPLQKF